jgi:hypothetical protein
MRDYRDPITSPTSFDFIMGGSSASVLAYRKNVNDSRIYNHIVVTGEGAGVIPVVAEARNTDNASPTSIDNIGERTYRYNSKFITTLEQAQAVADQLLAIHALEEYEMDLSTLVIPWLEAGEVVKFDDPNPHLDQPTRFMLHSFTIPMTLEPMSATTRRAENIGAALESS